MTLRIACLLLAAGLCPAQHVLENAKVRIAFDNQGAITELIDKQSAPGRNLIARRLPGFWKLIFHRGRALENVVEPQHQQYRIARDGARLNISADKLRFESETLDIALSFTVRLEDDEVRWTARIENRSPVTIADFFFPQVGGIQTLGDAGASEDLIWPSEAGQRLRNFKTSMRPTVGGLPNIEEPVNAVADRHIELTYPSFASMNWYEYTNDRRGIYFGCYDGRFQTSLMRVSRLYQFGGALQFSFAQFLFLRQGETWTSGETVVSPHPGTWHGSADKYRKWANTWFRQQPPPGWVKRMKGMYLVILRQQYGDRMWSYRDLPYLYGEARRNGIDTIALFGWTEAGHDNQYPIYKPDPEMGGEQALREGLAAVAKAGGHTILYINGHIMDADAAYYRESGHRMAARTIWGGPYYEQYSKSHESAFLGQFSRKLFVPACAGDPEWERIMRGVGTQLLAYGPSGVIYDQVGGMPAYPCFGNASGERATAAFGAGRLRYLAALLDNLRRTKPTAGMMGEHFTDAYAQLLHVIHGAGPGFALTEPSYPQLMRYTFPEVIATQRHPAPRADRKQANFALAYGFRFELEVRYRADVATVRNREKEHLSEYMRKVSALRDRYWDLLGEGRFLDNRGITNTNPAVTATVFARENRRAVVLWNHTAKLQNVAVDVPGRRYLEAAGVDGPLRARPKTLQPQEVAVLVYE